MTHFSVFVATISIVCLVPLSVIAEGAIKIRSKPTGAEIRIDGQYRGKTPDTIDVSNGHHTIEISAPGYAIASKSIRINGDFKSISFTLEKGGGGSFKVRDGSSSSSAVRPGVLSIDTKPRKAKLWFDDEPIQESSPVTIDVQKSGYHVVRANISGLLRGDAVVERRVKVRPGKKPTKITLDLRKQVKRLNRPWTEVEIAKQNADRLEKERRTREAAEALRRAKLAKQMKIKAAQWKKQSSKNLWWSRCPIGQRYDLKKKKCMGNKKWAKTPSRAEDICPRGSRLPTLYEVMSLFSSCKDTLHSKLGERGKSCRGCKSSSNCREVFGSDFWSESFWTSTEGPEFVYWKQSVLDVIANGRDKKRENEPQWWTAKFTGSFKTRRTSSGKYNIFCVRTSEPTKP